MTAIGSSPIVRDRDMQVVRHFVENLSSYRILNLYSIKGMGKTTFLQSVWDEYHERLPIALVGVRDLKQGHANIAFGLERFLGQIVDQLNAQLSYGIVLNISDNEHVERVAELAGKISRIADAVAEAGLLLLLLVDDYDYMPDKSRDLFEDTVLSKVIQPSSRVAVILTSEQALSFKNRPDLRIRLKSYRLGSLTANDLALSFPQYDALASEILKWTGGMPDLVHFLVDRASKWSIVSLDAYQSHREELLGRAYRKQIRDTVFPDVRRASDEVLDALALLRRFDVAILSGILPKISPETFGSYKQKHYLDLIHELGSRVYWREQGGYALDDTLKVMLSSYIRTFEQSTYERVNHIVTATYEGWLRQRYRQHYLLEMLYHRMMLEKAKGTEDVAIARLLSDILSGYVEGKRETGPREVDEIDSLKHKLEHDMDLRPFVGQAVFDTIERVLMTE